MENMPSAVSPINLCYWLDGVKEPLIELSKHPEDEAKATCFNRNISAITLTYESVLKQTHSRQQLYNAALLETAEKQLAFLKDFNA